MSMKGNQADLRTEPLELEPMEYDDGPEGPYEQIAPGGGPGTVIWAVFFAPIGLGLAIYHWVRHCGTGYDAVAAAIGGILTTIAVVSIIVSAASGPPMPANGGFTNMKVLEPSITQTLAKHNKALGLPTPKSTKCVLDYGNTYTCIVTETSGGVSVPIPITVVVTGNGTQWRSS